MTTRVGWGEGILRWGRRTHRGQCQANGTSAAAHIQHCAPCIQLGPVLNNCVEHLRRQSVYLEGEPAASRRSAEPYHPRWPPLLHNPPQPPSTWIPWALFLPGGLHSASVISSLGHSPSSQVSRSHPSPPSSHLSARGPVLRLTLNPIIPDNLAQSPGSKQQLDADTPPLTSL